MYRNASIVYLIKLIFYYVVLKEFNVSSVTSVNVTSLSEREKEKERTGEEKKGGKRWGFADAGSRETSSQCGLNSLTEGMVLTSSYISLNT